MSVGSALVSRPSAPSLQRLENVLNESGKEAGNGCQPGAAVNAISTHNDHSRELRVVRHVPNVANAANRTY